MAFLDDRSARVFRHGASDLGGADPSTNIGILSQGCRQPFPRGIEIVPIITFGCGIFLLHMVLTALFVAIPFALVDVLALERDAHWRVYVPVLLVSIVLMAPMLIAGMRRRLTFVVFRIAIVLLLGAFSLLFAGHERALTLLAGIGIFFIGFNLLEAMLPSLVTRIAPGYAQRHGDRCV